MVPASVVPPVESVTVQSHVGELPSLAVAENCVGVPMVAVVGVTVTVTAGAVTFTVAEPDLEVSSVEVAVIVAVPVAELPAVNKPLELMVPILEGLTDQVTVVVYAPVPVTLSDA